MRDEFDVWIQSDSGYSESECGQFCTVGTVNVRAEIHHRALYLCHTDSGSGVEDLAVQI